MVSDILKDCIDYKLQKKRYSISIYNCYSN